MSLLCPACFSWFASTVAFTLSTPSEPGNTHHAHTPETVKLVTATHVRPVAGLPSPSVVPTPIDGDVYK
ncbi:MAG: hypothetical protein AAF670_08805 [Planctomycetota bacterium]